MAGFIPHTDEDVRAMLEVVGATRVDELFDPIPPDVKLKRPLDVPEPLSEMELLDHLRALAEASSGADLTCFAGGGAYEHHVPSAARALAGRGEFTTSYTPYQPELSQGVLQAVFEFQSLVCELYGMEVANASLYDGASALVEAVNLSARVTGRDRVLVAGTLHPHYLAVLRTYTSGLGFTIETLAPGDDGIVDWSEVDATGAACVVVQHPNFFGRLEDLALAARRAHDGDALAVAVTDPTAMGILASPGELGADVVVGEGASFGNPMMYGGPYVGFFATRLKYVRQVPGRIAGATLDADGRRAFVLTLQAREQHIRRAKATSNVCTNQTLMAIAAAVHLGWLGPQGLKRLGELCLTRTAYAAERLASLPGCSLAFEGPTFKEFALRTPLQGDRLARGLADRGFLVGPSLGRWFPELDDCLLVAVTERRSLEEVDSLTEAIEKAMAEA